MQSPYPASAKTLRLGDALELGGSLVVFAFSFAPFVTISVPGFFGGRDLEDSQNAWATETFMAPLTWFVVLAGLLQIAAVALRYLGGPPQLLGFRLPQLEVGLGLFMLVVLFSMVTSEKHVIFGAGTRVQGEAGAKLGIGWGAILMLVGSLAAAVGALLTHLSVGPTIFPMASRPAAPAAPGDSYPAAAGQPYPPAGSQPYAAPQAQPYAPPPGQPYGPPAGGPAPGPEAPPQPPA
ncbi:MAG: hypothetical protein IRZ05_21055, partial [Micromonosporaceae bacterium]|nr:hypothetical protein [Micromonosporaceae bacterium]